MMRTKWWISIVPVGQFVLLLLWRARWWWITIESVNGSREELVSPTNSLLLQRVEKSAQRIQSAIKKWMWSNFFIDLPTQFSSQSRFQVNGHPLRNAMHWTDPVHLIWFVVVVRWRDKLNYYTLCTVPIQQLAATSAPRFGEIRDVEEEATSKEIPLDSKIATANVDNKRQRQRGRQWDRQERNTFAYNNTTTDEPIEMANCYFNNCIFIRPTIRPIKTSALRISSPGRDR